MGTVNGEVRGEETSSCALQCIVVNKEGYYQGTYIIFSHLVVVSMVPFFLTGEVVKMYVL
jgi:hypothetical protein